MEAVLFDAVARRDDLISFIVGSNGVCPLASCARLIYVRGSEIVKVTGVGGRQVVMAIIWFFNFELIFGTVISNSSDSGVFRVY